MVLVADAAPLPPPMAERTEQFGLVMEVCGVVMTMMRAWVPGMIALISFAMLTVSGLMILNGALMR